MERYSLIVVADEMSPIRRFDVLRRTLRRAAWAGGVFAFVLVVGLIDYVRLRIDQRELDALRQETAEQRDRIASFDEVLVDVNQRLEKVRDLERKVRIIANLPGSVASGGADDVTEAGPEQELEVPGGQGGDSLDLPFEGAARGGPFGLPSAGVSDPAERVSLLRSEAQRLGIVADARGLSLKELIDQLESKRDYLESSPAIWPAKGWLTSRYGMRVSPFTGRRQFHAGLDIAGEIGTDVIAPARGKIVRAGRRGPLGFSVTIDHGYGVRTLYGHLNEVKVERGQTVERGDVIASLGNTGRSTGPHLHYVVEVNGKTRNPLDYIFD